MKVLDDSLIIITSDHGEEFLEHGLLRHGFQLYDETIRVPLIFYWKNHLDAQVKNVIASGIDIAPTIMDLCGQDMPSSMLGSSLLRKKNDKPILFCTHFINQNQRGMRMGKWKLIENAATGEIKVFDMGNDPGERQNLFNDSLKEREKLLKSYKQLLAKHAVKLEDKEVKRPAQPSAMDDETREQLEGLGYL
jgi:arylsulfatase A-like enzyme